MRIHLGLCLVALLSVSGTSCADPVTTGTLNIAQSQVAHHDYDASVGHTYVLNDTSVFVAKEGDNGTIVAATLFFNGAIDKAALVNRMLWVLEATNAPAEFRSWARKNLARNRRFEQDSFVMPLKSFDLETHEFTYSNTERNQLYILAYRRLKSGG